MTVDVTDYSDPCQIAAKLREVIALRIIAGGGTITEIRMGERWVRYGQMPLADLKAELTRYENECALKTTNGPATRYAIRAGSVRRWPFE